MASLKEYEVTAKGFVDLNQKPTKVGDKVLLPPRHGNTLSGLRFRALKPTGRTAEQAAEAEESNQPKEEESIETEFESRQMIFDSEGLTRYLKELHNKNAILELGTANGVDLDGSATRADLEAEAELALSDRATSSGLVVNLDTLPPSDQ